MKKTNQSKALRHIYDRLQAGVVYDWSNRPRSYLIPALYMDEYGDYIHWNNFGGSAMKPSLKNLKWILEHMFEMKPSEFIEAFTEYND